MGLLLSGKNPAAYKTAERTSFTATAGQTTFTVPVGYNVGDIDVYLNGIRLIDADDFYATNGTTVVLASGANLGDSLVVVCYYNFLNSSSYTKAETDARYVGLGGTSPMTTYLRTPNYGISSYSDSASASLEASPGLGTQGVGIKASGRSMATTGGELTYVSDTRGASGAHKFYGWNGTGLTAFGGFDSSGRLTTPNQPAFTVGSNAGPTVSTSYTKITTFGLTLLNVGNGWNSSTQRFTAPVAGTYIFTTSMLPPVANVHTIAFFKNGASFSGFVWGYSGGGTRLSIGVTAAIPLNVNEYVEVFGQSPNAQDGWDNSGYFSGFLLG